MASVNKVILLGNLGRDPETRYTTGGDAVTNLNIATSEQWKDKNGEKQERTEWHRVVLFGRQAEIAGEYLKKGRSVYIEGRLQTRKYTDKDGVEKYSTEIVGDRMQLIGGARATAVVPTRISAQAPVRTVAVASDAPVPGVAVVAVQAPAAADARPPTISTTTSRFEFRRKVKPCFSPEGLRKNCWQSPSIFRGTFTRTSQELGGARSPPRSSACCSIRRQRAYVRLPSLGA